MAELTVSTAERVPAIEVMRIVLARSLTEPTPLITTLSTVNCIRVVIFNCRGIAFGAVLLNFNLLKRIVLRTRA